MRGRRMGRPGVVGTMARTAVIAGTATAVSNKVSSAQAGKANAAAAEQQAALESQAEMAAMQAQVDAMQAQQAQAAPPPPAAAAPDDLMSQLSKLADLKAAGVLSEEEFAAAKAKLLA